MIATRFNPLGIKPYAYEVEYLETDGQAYVDTGICPTANFTFDTIIAATNLDNTVYWGCRSSGNYQTDNLQCYLNWSPNGIFNTVRLISTSANNSQNFNSYITPTPYTIYEIKNLTVVPTMENLWHSIFICGMNNLGVLLISSGIPRVGRLAMYDNGIPVADIISVVDLNGTPCFYDQVRKIFLYTPVGAFIAGPKI